MKKRKQNFSVLALGSNLGFRGKNLEKAIELIGSVADIERVSPVYGTLSLLKDDQPDYFNLCLSIRTDFSESELLGVIKAFEKKIGRIKEKHWGCREIDIDIIDFNGKKFKSEILEIPHPEIENRSFVLYPLKDIYPNYKHPISCRTIDDMVKLVSDDLSIHVIGVLKWQS